MKTLKGGMGHELGEYEHNRGPRLYNWNEAIESGRWILEVMIYNKELDRTSFYENVYLEE